MKVCAFENCNRKHWAKGYCKAHSLQWYRTGILQPLREVKPFKPGESKLLFAQAMWTDSSECILWPFGKDAAGYARLHVGGKMVSATREMCRAVYGPPASENLFALHSCGNGHLGCINPRHLHWGTHSENELDKRKGINL
jgi:hypothetical protein